MSAAEVVCRSSKISVPLGAANRVAVRTEIDVTLNGAWGQARG